ncbi:hypothetical protein AV530_014704 [Patagioenas fasciata monilis]|uniref:C2H2-type domain-containing protein n=1 Tax=Patagioenas fasciata monilis TaxID=372326 RepID=A0A1V4JJ04_PATFA|nr:hypothetical protein AV530_014704 [Patagioenas fasciata monilis]
MLLPTEPDVPRRAQARWGHGNQPCRSCGDGDGRGDLAESGTEDSIIHIKQEEELCAADEQEEEAGEAPGEPCPEQAFYEPEAPGAPEKGEEGDPRELPGAGDEELPRDPDPGFQAYATDVLSWIKQEEEPRCPERRRSEKEETSTHSSTGHDGNAKRDPPSDCIESTACDSGGGPAGEEQPPAEGEETFPAENPPGSPCWDPRPDKPGPWGRCRQHSGGSPANQQQGQGRGKSYICSDCGKSFICHSWLVRHQMTHTGERPYKCSECDKSYRRKDYLLNHQRQHSGERLFQCPLCRKRFVRRRSFMKHQESHVQETHLTLGGWPCTELRGSVMHSI